MSDANVAFDMQRGGVHIMSTATLEHIVACYDV